MSSTHLCLHYHLIFGTKDHRPLITKDWRDRLHAYMGGIVRNLGGVPVEIGGVEDHAHLLVGLRATHRLADVLRDLKSNATTWVHEEPKEMKFAWQEGYGAFTVSPSQIETVRRYIANQEEHHRTRSFMEEYRELLKKCGIPYDERYL